MKWQPKKNLRAVYQKAMAHRTLVEYAAIVCFVLYPQIIGRIVRSGKRKSKTPTGVNHGNQSGL